MDTNIRVWFLTCVLVSSLFAAPGLALSSDGAHAGAGAASNGAAAQPAIDSFAYTGSGNVSDGTDRLTLWQTVAHEFSVEVGSTAAVEEAQLCLRIPMGEREPRELTCQSASLSANETTTATLSIDRWPENATGQRTVEAVLLSGDAVVADASMQITVIRQDGDLDEDGLANEQEVSAGSDMRAVDTDDDGLADGEEVNTYETSPVNNDTDNDTLSDRAEIEDHQTDPLSSDTDDDGLRDDRELELETDPNREDTDGDGLADGLEVNTYETGPLSPDSDDDGLDDGEEVNEFQTNPTKADTDGDGLDDNLEVNTYETDPNQIDSDDDGLEDGAEVDEYRTDPTNEDTDGDGLNDGEEVNTYGTNPTNEDTDGDGLNDGPEVNRYETDPTKVDTDGDGSPDGDEVQTSERFVPEVPLPVIAAAALVIVFVGGVVGMSDRVTVGHLQERFGGRRASSGADAPTEPPESAAVPADDGGTASTDDAESASEPGTEEEEGIPPEFLSDEERVLSIVDDHGGRVRQSVVVEETDWSKSKVSRVLSEMEDEDTIVKIDVGRGNVVARPEDLPDDARSLFDE